MARYEVAFRRKAIEELEGTIEILLADVPPATAMDDENIRRAVEAAEHALLDGRIEFRADIERPVTLKDAWVLGILLIEP